MFATSLESIEVPFEMVSIAVHLSCSVGGLRERCSPKDEGPDSMRVSSLTFIKPVTRDETSWQN